MNLKKVNKIFHKEEGCIRYDLHQDKEGEVVLIYEMVYYALKACTR